MTEIKVPKRSLSQWLLDQMKGAQYLFELKQVGDTILLVTIPDRHGELLNAWEENWRRLYEYKGIDGCRRADNPETSEYYKIVHGDLWASYVGVA